MGLDGYQKNYIKRNLRNYTVSKIASDLELPESEIFDYLKKKWTLEKYNKFLKNQFSQNTDRNQSPVSFSFVGFFRKNRFILAFLAFLVFAVYANSLGNGFVSDDIAGFARNENLGRFFTIFSGPAHFSLPSFFQLIAYHIGGLHPLTFRIINIFFHLGSTLIIYLLLSLALEKRVAFIAASLFAVHPILIEAVGWISGAPYSMYAFFFLLSFLFYLFSDNNRKYFYYSIAFYLLTLFSSGNAIALFLIFPLYEIAFGSIRYNWKKILPYFSISLFIIILLAAKIGYRVSAIESQSYQSADGMFNPFVQVPIAISSYLRLIFWPAALSLYQTEMAFSRGQFLISLFIFLVFLGLIVWGYFKNRKTFFWLSFFIITLLPTLTPFKISLIVAERYVYLGTLGLIVVVAILFDRIMKFSENAKMVSQFALVVIIASLSARTIVRNQDWKNEDTLWVATAKVAHSGQQIHNNLGDVYARQGDLNKAAEEFQKAIGINPNYADAYHNLGNTYQAMGQLEAAVENYKKALSINPNLWQSYQNMAAIYFNAEQFDLALENIKKALEINPNDENLKQNVKVVENKAQGK